MLNLQIKKCNNHLVLPKFLLKQFATKQNKEFPIYVLDINNKTISITSRDNANTSLNFYSNEIEEYFSKLESKFSNLCKSIFDKLDVDDVGLLSKLNSNRTKSLLKDWTLASYGRVFFNNQKNISIHKDNIYDRTKRNSAIKMVVSSNFPPIASQFIDNAYITLVRNSTETNFILSPCHWIESEIYNYGVVLFPISPRIAICLIEMQWRKSLKYQLKKNDVAYLNYSDNKFVDSFNYVIYKHTIELGLKNIYSCSEKELLEIIKR